MTRWRNRLSAALRLGGRKATADAPRRSDSNRASPSEAFRDAPDPPNSRPRPVHLATRPAPAAGDVIAVIAPQHEHVKALLEAVRQQTGRRRAAAFHILRLTLALHETAEQQAIHPLAGHQLGIHDRAAVNRIAEEETAGQTIGALELLNVDSDQFNATFGHLAISVTDHAVAEEADEWPALLGITDPPVLKAMVEQMQAVTQLAGDPSAPGMEASFTQMQDWAKARLPTPPSP